MLTAAILCSLVLWTQCLKTSPQQDFDLEQFAGQWYRVGMAYESPLFIKYKDRMLISKGILVLNENGGANLTMWTMMGPKLCMHDFYVYDKTEVPGLFTYYSKRHKTEKDITVVETNYTEYGVVLKYRNINKEYTQVALYGRTPSLRPELVEHFRLYALSLGFSEESIVVPSIIDPCPIPEPRNIMTLPPKPPTISNTNTTAEDSNTHTNTTAEDSNTHTNTIAEDSNTNTAAEESPHVPSNA